MRNLKFSKKKQIQDEFGEKEGRQTRCISRLGYSAADKV